MTTFFKGSFYNIVNSLTPSIVNFITIIIVGRAFSVGDFGLYSYILRILALISFPLISVSMFAFSYYFQKIDKDKISDFFNTFLKLSFVISILIVGLLISVSGIIAPKDLESLLVFNIGIVLLAFYIIKGVYSEAFNALFEFKKRAFLEIFKNAVWLFLIILLAVQNRLTLLNAFLTIYIIYTIYTIIAASIIKHKIKNPKFSFRQNLIFFKPIFNKIKFFLPAVFLNSFLTLLVFFYLSILHGKESLGIFSYSFTITFIFATMSTGLSSTILPYSAKLGPSNISKYLWGTNFGLIYSFVPLLLFLFFFHNTFMNLTFGREFLNLTEIMVFFLLLIAAFFKSIGGNTITVLNGIGKTKDFFKIAIITFSIQIVMAFFLIRKFSVLGGAEALLIIYFIQTLLAFVFLVPNKIKFCFYGPKEFLRIILRNNLSKKA